MRRGWPSTSRVARWRSPDDVCTSLLRCATAPRRGARVVESGGLENRCARKGTEGSNPSPSASESENTAYRAGSRGFGDRAGTRFFDVADELDALLGGFLGLEGLQAAHGVDGGRKAGVRRDLDEHFAQLVDAEADVAGGVQVHVQLGFAAALGGQHGHGRQLAVAQGQAGAGVDVAEGVLDDVAAEVAERVHYGLT